MSDTIYFIGNDAEGPVKIGFTVRGDFVMPFKSWFHSTGDVEFFSINEDMPTIGTFKDYAFCLKKTIEGTWGIGVHHFIKRWERAVSEISHISEIYRELYEKSLADQFEDDEDLFFEGMD